MKRNFSLVCTVAVFMMVLTSILITGCSSGGAGNGSDGLSFGDAYGTLVVKLTKVPDSKAISSKVTAKVEANEVILRALGKVDISLLQLDFYKRDASGSFPTAPTFSLEYPSPSDTVVVKDIPARRYYKIVATIYQAGANQQNEPYGSIFFEVYVRPYSVNSCSPVGEFTVFPTVAPTTPTKTPEYAPPGPTTMVSIDAYVPSVSSMTKGKTALSVITQNPLGISIGYYIFETLAAVEPVKVFTKDFVKGKIPKYPAALTNNGNRFAAFFCSESDGGLTYLDTFSDDGLDHAFFEGDTPTELDIFSPVSNLSVIMKNDEGVVGSGEFLLPDENFSALSLHCDLESEPVIVDTVLDSEAYHNNSQVASAGNGETQVTGYYRKDGHVALQANSLLPSPTGVNTQDVGGNLELDGRCLLDVAVREDWAVVAYFSQSFDLMNPASSGVCLRRYKIGADHILTPFDSSVVVVPYTKDLGYSLTNLRVTIDKLGRVAVAWNDFRANDSTKFLIAGACMPETANTVLSPYIMQILTGFESTIGLSCSDDGRFVIVWEDYVTIDDEEHRAVKKQDYPIQYGTNHESLLTDSEVDV